MFCEHQSVSAACLVTLSLRPRHLITHPGQAWSPLIIGMLPSELPRRALCGEIKLKCDTIKQFVLSAVIVIITLLGITQSWASTMGKCCDITKSLLKRDFV